MWPRSRRSHGRAQQRVRYIQAIAVEFPATAEPSKARDPASWASDPVGELHATHGTAGHVRGDPR